MDGGSRSRERVAARLDELGDAYDAVPVNQTTVGVPTDCYERARERVTNADRALTSVYVAVRNEDDDVLVVDEETNELVGPIECAPTEMAVEGSAAVRERTGVDCTIEGVERTTILGVHDEDDPECSTVYQLVVELAARYVAGDPGDVATWGECPGPTPVEFA
jgi:hypothetical protein